MNGVLRLLALDLGAESGRAVLGTLGEGRIELDEIHRFRTEGIVMLGTRQWDFTRIYGEMLNALSIYTGTYGSRLDSIGIDTWGVDFGLLDRDGKVLSNPVHYRDHRNDGMMEKVYEIVPREEVYRATGIQLIQINTLYQLYSMIHSNSPQLEIADCLLMMSDLFAYLLCGRKACEYTNASTTQLLNPWEKKWNVELIGRLGLSRHIFQDPVQPGTVLGAILPEIAADTGVSPKTPVIAPGSHDTASAVAAVPVSPASGPWAYLSSGTWSLLGTELDSPMVTDESLAMNFTNEGGAGGKIRFLKNIIGLWLLQECRREWTKTCGDIGYDQIVGEAESAEPMRSLIDVDDPRLLAPENMEEAIRVCCRERGYPEPESRAQVTRCILESLALKYRENILGLDQILGRKTEVLHVIGGGAKNRLLCQLTADACGIPVLAGPVEATALGNLMVQAIALGALESLEEGRKMIAQSMELERYEPNRFSAKD